MCHPLESLMTFSVFFGEAHHFESNSNLRLSDKNSIFVFPSCRVICVSVRKWRNDTILYMARPHAKIWRDLLFGKFVGHAFPTALCPVLCGCTVSCLVYSNGLSAFFCQITKSILHPNMTQTWYSYRLYTHAYIPSLLIGLQNLPRTWYLWEYNRPLGVTHISEEILSSRSTPKWPPIASG